eukprot:3753898-Rhodomonas_salina.1
MRTRQGQQGGADQSRRLYRGVCAALPSRTVLRLPSALHGHSTHLQQGNKNIHESTLRRAQHAREPAGDVPRAQGIESLTSRGKELELVCLF